ncbi:MAG: terminase TerL endonuclease subunit [Chloroflexota bacterium]
MLADRLWQRLIDDLDPDLTTVSQVDARVDRDPVAWIQSEFYIPETGQPIVIYPAQEAALRAALARDDNGLFHHSTVLWSAIKKSAKSTIAAAVGMWFAFRRPYSSIKVLANDLKQAQSRVFEYMVRAVRLHPEWSRTCKVTRTTIELPNRSKIEAIPVDPTGEAGGNDDLVIYTELWGWQHPKHVQMWTESTLSPTKYGESMRWCESYAGYRGQSVVLEQLYDNGVEKGRPIETAAECYVNDAARLFVLWNTTPTLPWQTKAYYAQETAMLSPEEFSRVHENEWAEKQNPFVPYEWWDTCAGSPVRSREVVIALDAAVSDDCFALVAVSATTENGRRVVHQQAVAVIEPPEGGKIDYDDARQILRRWKEMWRVTAVVYDPYQLHDFATRGRKELRLNFESFSQGNDRLLADKGLYDMIREGRIVHQDDPTLNAHIRNAGRKEQGENKMRIVKRKQQDKVDAAVALSMAAFRAKPGSHAPMAFARHEVKRG